MAILPTPSCPHFFSAAASDAWNFDLGDLEDAPVDSEALGTRPPLRTRKKSRWRWKLPNIRFRDSNVPFDPFERYQELVLLLNLLAAIVLLSLSLVDPWASRYWLKLVFYAILGLHFIDACFDGGLARVFLLYSTPAILVAMTRMSMLSILISSLFFPYVLYVVVIRFRYVWPVHLLLLTSMLSSWVAVYGDRYEWIRDFRATWLN